MQLLPSWSERLGKHLHCQAQYNKAIPHHWIVMEQTVYFQITYIPNLMGGMA